MKRSTRVIKVRDMIKGDEITAVYTASGWVDGAPTARLHPDTTMTHERPGPARVPGLSSLRQTRAA